MAPLRKSSTPSRGLEQRVLSSGSRSPMSHFVDSPNAGRFWKYGGGQAVVYQIAELGQKRVVAVCRAADRGIVERRLHQFGRRQLPHQMDDPVLQALSGQRE